MIYIVYDPSSESEQGESAHDMQHVHTKGTILIVHDFHLSTFHSESAKSRFQWMIIMTVPSVFYRPQASSSKFAFMNSSTFLDNYQHGLQSSPAPFSGNELLH